MSEIFELVAVAVEGAQDAREGADGMGLAGRQGEMRAYGLPWP